MRRVLSYILVLLVLYTFYELSEAQFKKIGKKHVEEKVPCKVIKVYDGDTFKCRLKSGEEIRVRLIGVDTPESRVNPKAKRDAERTGFSLKHIIRLGKKATEFTKKLIPPGTVVYLETDVQIHDRYGRLLAYVYLPDGRMLNEVLLEEGYAKMMTIPPNVKYVERFRKAQRKAILEGRGLWSEGM